MTPARSGWVSIYDADSETSFREGARVARSLSEQLDAVAIHLFLFDSDVVKYSLCESGRVLDEFDSRPDYFGPGDALAQRAIGSPSTLSKYCAVPIPEERLSLLLVRGVSHTFGREEARLKDLAAALGVNPKRAFVRFSNVLARAPRTYVRIKSDRQDAKLAVHEAAKRGDLEALRRLLSGGIEWNERDVRGRTLLDVAVECDQEGSLGVLLERGVDQHSVNTALRRAIGQQSLSVIRTLLANGADPNWVDENGGTPIFRAVHHPQASVEIVNLLLGAGARTDSALDVRFIGKVDRRRTVLHYAASVAPVEVVRALIAADPDVNRTDGLGLTPLMLAAEQARVSVVWTLLLAGADVGIADDQGRTALEWARRAMASLDPEARRGFDETVGLLTEALHSK